MRRDIKEMMNCDFVAVLKNWEKSRGANIEVQLARNLSIPIIDSISLNKIL